MSQEAEAFRKLIEIIDTLMGESLMLGLRLLDGISIQQFEERFQTSFNQAFGGIVSSLQKKDLVTIEENRLRLSEKGLFLADSVILEFIA